MKKALSLILALVMCLTLCACGCEHEWSDWKTVKKATCFEDGSQKRTCSLCNEVESAIINKTGDCGSKLSDGVMENLAKNYVKDQFKQTAGGYKITSYTFGSISKAGNDDLNIYQYYTVYGSYAYNGKDKFGQTKKGEDTFTYNVKVYQWTKNPDGFREVSGR